MVFTALDWLTEVIAEQPQVWCEDPEVSDGSDKKGGRTHVTYRLLYKQMGAELLAVRRRYSEFENLRNVLLARFNEKGILIPTLPPKNSLGALSNMINTKVDRQFIRHRTLGFNMFADTIINIPFVRYDTAWRSFLSNADSLDTTNGASNEGYVKLNECLRDFTLPTDGCLSDRVFSVKEEVLAMDKLSKSLLEKVKSLAEKTKAVSAAQDAVLVGLRAWSNGEKSLLKQLSDGNGTVLAGETVSHTATCFTDMFGKKTRFETDAGEYVLASLANGLEQQIMLADACRDLFSVHEKMVENLDSTRSKLVKTEQKIATTAATASASTLSKLQEQVTELQISISAQEYKLRDFYKGFIFFTVPLLARLRAGAVRKALCNYVAVVGSLSYGVHATCQQFFNDIKLSSVVATNETARMLELLGLFSLPALPELTEQPSNVILRTVVPEETDDDEALLKKLEAGSITNQAVGSAVFLSKEGSSVVGLYERALALSRGEKPPALGAQASHSSVGNTTAESVSSPISPPPVPSSPVWDLPNDVPPPVPTYSPPSEESFLESPAQGIPNGMGF